MSNLWLDVTHHTTGKILQTYSWDAVAIPARTYAASCICDEVEAISCTDAVVPAKQQVLNVMVIISTRLPGKERNHGCQYQDIFFRRVGQMAGVGSRYELITHGECMNTDIKGEENEVWGRERERERDLHGLSALIIT